MNAQSINIQRFYAKLEQMLRREVEDSFPHDWHEDYITRRILAEYRKQFSCVEMIDVFSAPIKIESASYKLSGKNETNFGDIAFIVRIHYPDKNLEGVAFLEAKKKNAIKGSFDAIRDKQFKTIITHAPRSLLLLYDHQGIHQYFPFLSESNFFLFEQYTYAAVIPINLVTSINEKNNNLYRFSIPLSYQILFRYFRGLDLEFDKRALDIAKGYDRQVGTPKYLINVSVSYDEVGEANFTEVNRDIFIPIDD